MGSLNDSMASLLSNYSKFNKRQILFLFNLDRLSPGERTDIIMGHIDAEVYLSADELITIGNL